MSIRIPSIAFGLIIIAVAGSRLNADQVEMQNGDLYSGKVLSVSADTVVLDSEVLGKINVPRKKVASLAFGTNAVLPKAVTPIAQVSVPTNLPSAAALAALVKTNANLSAALGQPGATTNAIRQIREQMLAGSPEAASKFDEMIHGLMTGQLSVADLRRQAKSSADQLRALKQDLGPDAGDALDGYLEILDQFVNETASEPANTSSAPPPNTQAP